MSDTVNHQDRRAARLQQLTRTGADSAMGQLLRRFWQPVALSAELAAGKAQALRVLGEDLTLYRSAEGTAFIVGGHCAHRLTMLHTGWIEGDEIRCMYHGWRYNGAGACTQRPAERDTGNNVKIAGYPVREYAGLIFAYMGPGDAPAFDLPRKHEWERPGNVIIARKQVWDVNWLQMVENSLDAAHVSFVHAYGKKGIFIEAVTEALPELEYIETEAGIRQIATRSSSNIRISDWTFPNNNHISVPGIDPDAPWMDVGVWMVPVDDGHTARVNLYASPAHTPEADAKLQHYFNTATTYNAAEHYDDLIHRQLLPDDSILALTNAQDYIAQRGQGQIVDRTNETLGRSDAGVALLRRVFQRECDLIASGATPKTWRRLEEAADMFAPKTAAQSS